MSDSTVVGGSYRWHNDDDRSPVLPPVTSLYPDHQPEFHSSEHTRDWRLSPSHNHSYPEASSWEPVENMDSSNENLDKRSRKRSGDDDLVRDLILPSRPKRTLSEPSKYIAGDAHGLYDSDVDTILDCAADISGTLGPRTPSNGLDHSHIYNPPTVSSPVEPPVPGKPRGDSRGNLSDLNAQDLDRLVSKATQVVDIFEKAKKRIYTSSSGPSTPLPTFSLRGNDMEPVRSKVETMEELAEISSQRRAIAMAGARSKPDLGTSSISMFRYSDNSKKKHKRAGTEKLQCHSCKSTETPEWRKGPMGPRTLCNACGLIWAKLARKKSQSGDRFKLSKDSPTQQHATENTFFLNPIGAEMESRVQQSIPVAHSISSLDTLEAIESTTHGSHGTFKPDLLQYSLDESDFCRHNTHNSRNEQTRGDKFKLSFLLD